MSGSMYSPYLSSRFLTDPDLAIAMRHQQMAQPFAQEGTSFAPVQSPFQGLARLAQAGIGALLMNKAEGEAKDITTKRDQQAQEFQSQIAPLLMGGATPAPTPMGQALSGQAPAAPNYTTQQLPPADLQPTIDKAADAYGIPKDVAYALFRQESNNGKASPNIGQVTGGTAANPGYGVPPISPQDLADPAKNIDFSMRYLAARAKDAGVKDWNDPAQRALALKAYNGGGDPNYVANVERWMPQQGASGAPQFAGPGAPSAPAPPQQPDPNAMLAQAQRMRAIAYGGMNQSNPQIQRQSQFLMHQADSLERQALAFQSRSDAAANRVPHTITMQDPDGKGVGIYEMTAQGPGRRLGSAPKQPGESQGPFGGNGIEAQAYNTLLSIGPKIANGQATDAERSQYALAYQHQADGKVQLITDPTDPTGQRQVLARIPGSVPSNFPAPDFKPGQAPAPAAAGAPAGAPGAPQVIPGTTKPAAPPSNDERLSAGFSARMTEAGRDLNDMEGRGISSGNATQSMLSSIPGVGNFLTSPDYQVYKQKAADWIRAKLRKESGAAIGEREMDDEFKTYFPQPGDSQQTIEAKRRSRAIAEKAMIENAGRAPIVSLPQQAPGAAPSGVLKFNPATGKIE